MSDFASIISRAMPPAFVPFDKHAEAVFPITGVIHGDEAAYAFNGRVVVRFSNGYAASIVANRHTSGLYDMAVMHGGKMVTDTGLTHANNDDCVIGDVKAINEALAKVEALSPRLTRKQIECMKRLRRGESVRELADELGALYLSGLVDDDRTTGRPCLTRKATLALLGVSPTEDTQPATMPETREIERPKLKSRPMLSEWARFGGSLIHISTETTIEDPSILDSEGLDELESYARAVVDLVAWIRHERAVRAQEGGE